ncbi:MAG: succinate dehydrogenase [Acaryochloridaceae cyanobacterium SU_2_1]|nr:succinate dehydrogenase [Acaryochloridaceae cyanobacterium SU_2_1]
METQGESSAKHHWSTQAVALVQSPIGKKLITGLTGLGLVGFVVIHLVANLTLFYSAEAYNHFGHWVASLGLLRWSLELGLLGFILCHALLGIGIYLNKRQARPQSYAMYQSAGFPHSLQTLSSRRMIVSGSAIAIFLVWHLKAFRFAPHDQRLGPGVEDLAGLVLRTLSEPFTAALYVGIALLLGLHLRHGIWSALQSIGLMGQQVKLALYGFSTLMALAIACGFFGLAPCDRNWLAGQINPRFINCQC